MCFFFVKAKGSHYKEAKAPRVADPCSCRIDTSSVVKSLPLFSDCRQSVSSLSGPLQVVPDIDDQVNHPEHLQEVNCMSSQIQICNMKPRVK